MATVRCICIHTVMDGRETYRPGQQAEFEARHIPELVRVGAVRVIEKDIEGETLDVARAEASAPSDPVIEAQPEAKVVKPASRRKKDKPAAEDGFDSLFEG